MSNARPCFAAIILLLLSSLREPVFGQAPLPPANEMLPIQDGPGPVPHPKQPTFPVKPPPDYSLKVYFDHRLPEAQKQALQPIKELFNKAKLGPPEDRIAYFRSVISPEARMVEGWSGLIHSVKKARGGTVVELRIFAKQEGMADTANIMEQYSIINGKIRYIGSFVPNDIPRSQMGF